MDQCHENIRRQQSQPAQEDSLASMCWPIIHQEQPQGRLDASLCGPYAPRNDMKWPTAEPWRRNLGQPRCGGQGRCQGDAQKCNSKYRYGVDDVGPCPSDASCKASFSCNKCPQECANPCPKSQGCDKVTTRCFDWPIPSTDACPPSDPNLDLRVPRADLNKREFHPDCCPTCRRPLVDMECGPMGFNF